MLLDQRSEENLLEFTLLKIQIPGPSQAKSVVPGAGLETCIFYITQVILRCTRV